jgi:hypothetical protein
MNKKFFITAALVSCFVICFAAIADMSGSWASVFNAPDGSQYPLTYTFKIDGSKLTGTLETSGMTVPLENGAVAGDSVKFSLSVQGVTYNHKGKYYNAADSIGVDVDFDGNKGHMTLKRPK